MNTSNGLINSINWRHQLDLAAQKTEQGAALLGQHKYMEAVDWFSEGYQCALTIAQVFHDELNPSPYQLLVEQTSTYSSQQDSQSREEQRQEEQRALQLALQPRQPSIPPQQLQQPRQENTQMQQQQQQHQQQQTQPMEVEACTVTSGTSPRNSERRHFVCSYHNDQPGPRDLQNSMNNTDASRSNPSFDCQHYFYQRALAFNASSLLELYDATTLPSSHNGIANYTFEQKLRRHQILHACSTLIMATNAFNMGLCFHLRGVQVTEGLRASCHAMAKSLYESALDTLGAHMMTQTILRQHIESYNQHHGTHLCAWCPALHVDSSCLLVVLLNNAAVLSYNLRDYKGCDDALLVLVYTLNNILLVDYVSSPSPEQEDEDMQQPQQPQQSIFLEGQDLLDLYRNGFLLFPPSTAPAA